MAVGTALAAILAVALGAWSDSASPVSAAGIDRQVVSQAGDAALGLAPQPAELPAELPASGVTTQPIKAPGLAPAHPYAYWHCHVNGHTYFLFTPSGVYTGIYRWVDNFQPPPAWCGESIFYGWYE